MKTPLKRAREARKLTQTDVAEQIGISQSTYSRIEGGGKTARETAQAIVAFFGQQSGLSELHVLYPERFPEPQSESAAMA